jgi:hypothetical protein
MIDEDGEPRWNDIDKENEITRRKICSNATSSTINPTWTYPGTNPDLRGERPMTNRLSHVTALQYSIFLNLFLFKLMSD